MLIDSHTHIFTPERYATYRQRVGSKVEKMISIHWYLHDLERTLKFSRTQPDVSIVAGLNIEIDLDEQLSRFEELFSKGEIVGIKLYPGYQHFYPYDARIRPFADLCAKHKRPLIIHTGDTRVRPGGYPLNKFARAIEVDEFAMRHPECKIIIAHLGFPEMMLAASVVNKNANVYADLSGIIDSVPDKSVEARQIAHCEHMLRQAVETYWDIAPKLLFGTDYAGEDGSLSLVTEYLELMRRIFPAELQASVLGETAEKLFFTNDPPSQKLSPRRSLRRSAGRRGDEGEAQ